MKIPVPVKVAALVVLTTLFYTYVGQLVPQKEVPAPEAIKIKQDATPAELAALGEEIVNGKGLCMTCHTGVRAPKLDGIAASAGNRVPGMSAFDYLVQSLYEPDAFIVGGFGDTQMPKLDEPPMNLTDGEIRALVAWLQAQGGTPTITMDTPIGAEAAGAPPAAAPGGTEG